MLREHRVDQRGVAGDADLDPVAVGEPRLLAQVLHRAVDLAREAFARERVVDRQIERDDEAALGRDRGAVGDEPTGDLVGREQLARDLEPAVGELANLAALDRRGDRLDLVAQPLAVAAS